jgi:hypothetical protein
MARLIAIRLVWLLEDSSSNMVWIMMTLLVRL